MPARPSGRARGRTCSPSASGRLLPGAVAAPKDGPIWPSCSIPHRAGRGHRPGQRVRHAGQPEGRYERRLAGGRNRDDLPDTAKPGVQGEQERGGAAVRAVVGLVGPVPLADEGGDLLGRESVAGPYRGSSLPAARRSTVETSGVV